SLPFNVVMCSSVQRRRKCFFRPPDIPFDHFLFFSFLSLAKFIIYLKFWGSGHIWQLLLHPSADRQSTKVSICHQTWACRCTTRKDSSRVGFPVLRCCLHHCLFQYVLHVGTLYRCQV